MGMCVLFCAQPVADFAGGILNVLTFGHEQQVTSALGLGDRVDRCSAAYGAGQIGGMVAMVLIPGGGEAAAADEADAADATAGDSIVSGWRGTNMSAPESFGVHYAKHGAGMTAGEYDAAAQFWASAPAGVTKPIQLVDRSWGTKWQTPGGGPGGIVDADGNFIAYWTK